MKILDALWGCLWLRFGHALCCRLVFICLPREFCNFMTASAQLFVFPQKCTVPAKLNISLFISGQPCSGGIWGHPQWVQGPWQVYSLLAAEQVWSLTKFYSIDLHNHVSEVKSAFSTNAQRRIALVAVHFVLGQTSAAHLTVFLYLCSSGSNAWSKLRAFEGRRVSSKSPSRVRDRDDRVAGRNKRE